MADNTEPKDPLRYRAYYWLLNLSFVFALIGLAEHITSFIIDKSGFGLEGSANLIAQIIVNIFGYFLPFFLMVAKFMRDDYMEGLWKRTVVVLAYAVAISPMVFVLIAWGCELGLPHDSAAYSIWRKFYEPFITPGQRGDVIVSVAWKDYMWLFVFIFQFLRWRASR
ncbi:MAG: hypothetical protein AAF251_01740 [Pseudomonadota bacterium]